jgi:HTH-type transcriptional regulator, sugar sensing transcriptional regulator
MIKVLKDFGLNENEANIYLELLKLGQSKVNELSKRLSLPRTTIYTCLDSLNKKGIVSYVIQSRIRFFEAADPKKLLRILHEKEASLSKILPELEMLKKSVDKKPFIEVYEGKDGLKTLFEDIIISKPEEHLIVASYEIFSILNFYFPNFIKRKEKFNISTKIMGPLSKKGMTYIKKYQSPLRNICPLPKSFDFRSRMDIYNDKIIISNMKKDNLVSILIKDKVIADSLRAMYNFCWNNAKKAQKLNNKK